MSIENLQTYKFAITGISPLLLHADIVEENDRLKVWQEANKKISVPGDDRSPPWTWQTYLYSDGEVLTVPSDNLMAALRKAGASFTLKGMTTFKSATQSGILILEENCPIVGPKGLVKVAAVHKFQDEAFATHCEKAKALGFSLFVKRAKIPGTGKKHVRVRARFEDWSLKGTMQISDPLITQEVLTGILTYAGASVGLGDWRPGSKDSPGQFGRFEVKVTK